MRGKGRVPAAITVRLGITPACAGKSFEKRAAMPTVGDHPRVCGEKGVIWDSGIEKAGSPPRVRGKVPFLFAVTVALGITPACAGKSGFCVILKKQKKDHPRVCGEKCTRSPVSMLSRGSPPRVRGKGPDLPPDVAAHGITPACAGKRLKRSHSIGHFSCILCLFHSVLHRVSASGGSRAGPCAPPCLPAQNTIPV